MKIEFLRHSLCLLLFFSSYVTVDAFRSPFTSGLRTRSFPRCPPEEELLPCVCVLKGVEVHIRCENSEIGKVGASLEVLKRRELAVEELYLVANRIPTIPARFFGSLELNKLFLMDNEMISISRNAFAGLEASLKHIYIRESLLEDVPYDTFDNLRDLRTIVMEGTSVSSIPRLFSLPHLEFLKIDVSRVSDINPESFRVMPSMRKIHISKSKLNTLRENSMEGLIYLKEIEFSDNNITWVHPGAFRNLEMVEELSMSGNKIEDAATAVIATRELKSLKVINISRNNIRFLMRGTFVDMPNLEEVNLSHNLLERIDHKAMYKLPNLYKLDLSNNNIYHFEVDVFTDVPSLEFLNIAKNNLSFIEDMKYVYRSLPNLRTLDLSANFIRGGNENSFGGHSKLQTLILNRNLITKLTKNLFRSLPNLGKLDLNQNHIKRDTENRVWELPKLQVLDLSQNDLTKIDGNLFSGLPQLTDLYLSFNLITDISTKTFYEVEQLKSLNISHNKISKLHSNTFKQLSELYELDFNFNKLTSIDAGLLDGLSSLEILHMSDNQITNINGRAFTDTVKLKSLDLSRNLFKHIPTEAISKLSSLRELNFRKNAINAIKTGDFNKLRIIETMDLSNNHIQNLHTNAFAEMNVLRDLDVSVNYIQSLPSTIFGNMKLIEKLNISHNFITTIGHDTFRNVKRLRILDLTNNSLTSLGQSVQDMPSLQGLFLNHNYISKLTNQTFINLPSLNVLFFSNNGLQTFEIGTFYNLSSLMYLDLRNNNLVEMNSYSFSSLTTLKELKLSQNQISSVEDYTFMNLPSIQSLELQDNVITHIGDYAFDKLPLLKFLNLSRNGLREIPEKALLKVPTLDVLDLSWNYIMKIRDSSFKSLQWLTVLLLHHNDLCHLSPNAFSGPKSLRVLMLHNNQLKRLHLSALRGPIQSLSLLDMGGNPFICDCELIWLREYLQQEEDRLVVGLQNVRNYFRGSAIHGTGRRLLPVFSSLMHRQPICAGPPEYAGMPITAVPPEAFFCNGRFRDFKDRNERCVPRFLDPEIFTAGNSGNGLSPDVLNTLLKLSNLSEILPGDAGGPSYLDYHNPIFVSGMSELINNYSQQNDVEKGKKSPVNIINTFTSPGEVNLEDSAEKSVNVESISSDFVTGDTPTIYAGSPSTSNQKEDEKVSNVGSLFGFRLPVLPNILDTIGKFKLPDLGLNVDWSGLPFGRVEEGAAQNIDAVAPILHHLKPTRGPDSSNALWVQVSTKKPPLPRPETEYDTLEVSSGGIRVNPPKSSGSYPSSSGRGNNTNHAKFYNIFSNPLSNPSLNVKPESPISFSEPSPGESENEAPNPGLVRPYTRSPFRPPVLTVGPGPSSGTPFLPGLVNNRPPPLPYIPNRNFYNNRQKEENIKNSEVRGIVPSAPTLKFPHNDEESESWSWSPPDNSDLMIGPSPYPPSSSFRPMKTFKNPIVVVEGPHHSARNSTFTSSVLKNSSTRKPSLLTSNRLPNKNEDRIIFPSKNNFQQDQNDEDRQFPSTIRNDISLFNHDVGDAKDNSPNTTPKNDFTVTTSPRPLPTSTSLYDYWTKSFVDDYEDSLSPTTEPGLETTTQIFNINDATDIPESTEKPSDITELYKPISLLTNLSFDDKNSSLFTFEFNNLNKSQFDSTINTTSAIPLLVSPLTVSTAPPSTTSTASTQNTFTTQDRYSIPTRWFHPTQSSKVSPQDNKFMNEANIGTRDPIGNSWWPPSSLGEGVTLVQGNRDHTISHNSGLVEAIDKGETLLNSVKHVSPSRSISFGSGIPSVEKVDPLFVQGVDLPPQYDGEVEETFKEEVELITEAPSAKRKQAGVMDWYYSNYNREYDPEGLLPVGGNAPPPSSSSHIVYRTDLLIKLLLCFILLTVWYT